ncbi:hypothetical protein K0U27_04150 [archaeon]|nr:hypothetical protein [archaeon]
MNIKHHVKQNPITFDTLRQKIGAIEHIEENKTTYKDHWWRAMLMSIALFVHAWIPSLFPTYASDKMNHNRG